MSWIGTKNFFAQMRESVFKPASVLALLYALTAFCGTQGWDYYKSHYDAKEKRVEAAVIGFIETTREFDALVPVLAHGVMDSGVADASVRGRLIANLNRQYSELEILAPVVSDKHAAAEYKESLSGLNDQLPNIKSVGEMREFWESVSRVLQRRKALTTELTRRISFSLE